MLLVRETWGNDIPISEVLRSPSKVLDFTPHGCVPVAFGDIRPCPCCINHILYASVQMVVSKADVRAGGQVVRHSCLVQCPQRTIILLVYITSFEAVASPTRRNERHSGDSRKFL